MVIGVSICVFRKKIPDEESYFLTKVLQILANRYPQHKFYVFKDVEFDGEMFPENIIPVHISYSPFWPAGYQAQFRVGRILKKTGAGVFISFNSFCLDHSKIPQCLIKDARSLNLSHGDQKVPWLIRKRTLNCFNRARCVVTFSQYLKKQILEQYTVAPEKIIVIDRAPRESYQPLDFEEHPAIKEKYTEGKEYFLYAGCIDPQKTLIPLLKAFSLFKKRQKCSMKLVLTGKVIREERLLTDLLSTYKYREDVVYLEAQALNDKQFAGVLCAAYALISIYDEGNYILEAMQCGVPVLGPSGTGIEEVIGDAGLCFEPDSIAGIADKMMLIYKDENLRGQLIEKAKERIRQFTWQRTVESLWQAVEENVN